MENEIKPVHVAEQKSPLIAAIASFFIPGLGQVYNGEGFVKGLLYLIGTLIGYIVFILPGLAIWLYGIYNAYKVSKKMNAGLIPYKGTTGINLVIYIVIALIIYFVYVLAIILFSAIIAAFVFGITSSTTSGTY